MIAFFQSLSVLGWVLIVLAALLVLNARNLFRLRSPLDGTAPAGSQQVVGGDVTKFPIALHVDQAQSGHGDPMS